MSTPWKQFLIGLAIASCWETTAIHAQMPKIPSFKRPSSSSRSAQPKPEKPLSLTGKGLISAVDAEKITIVADKKLWVLYPQPECVVEITGEAEADYLKAGMVVRVYGNFDKRFKPIAPVKHLEIITGRSSHLTLGVFPDILPPIKDNHQKEQKENEPEKNKIAKEPSGADPTPASEAAVPMMMVGRINLIKDGELLVDTGSHTIRAPLAGDAEIRVSISDFSAARRGDIVKKFRCEYFEPGTGFAKLLTIELADPLTGAKKAAKKSPAKPAIKTDVQSPK